MKVVFYDMTDEKNGKQLKVTGNVPGLTIGNRIVFAHEDDSTTTYAVQQINHLVYPDGDIQTDVLLGRLP